VEEVISLTRIVKNNPLSYIEVRIEEMERMLFLFRIQLNEHTNVLFHYDEKIEGAKLILNGWEKARNKLREEVHRISSSH
jgi:hypothetical protein